jgi:hypothetical protein
LIVDDDFDRGELAEFRGREFRSFGLLEVKK